MASSDEDPAALPDPVVVVPSRHKMQLAICRALGVDSAFMRLDEPPSNICSYCCGTGTLPGRNWVAQGYVEPHCWHCNGEGVIHLPSQPEWARR